MVSLFLAATAFLIPSAPASYALNDFGHQSRLQLLFNFQDMALVTTKAVSGEWDNFAALDAMLAGTDIVYEYVNGRTITLTRRAPPKTTKEDVATSAMLIAESCQFGRISAARADELLGVSPGRCWCCMAFEHDEPGNSFCAALVTAQACAAYDNSSSDEDERTPH